MKSLRLWNPVSVPDEAATNMDFTTCERLGVGRDAERYVEAYLKELGFQNVRIGLGTYGPDITFEDAGKTISVEVKTARLVARPSCWGVERVRHTRINDDMIAIVLPDGKVVLESMKDHLSKCTVRGRRSITQMVREMCPTVPKRVPLKWVAA